MPDALTSIKPSDEHPVVEEQPLVPEHTDADGYSKVGPGPMVAIRLKWTVHRGDDGQYYVHETIGEQSAPVVSGPMTSEAAVHFVDEHEDEAHQALRAAAQRDRRPQLARRLRAQGRSVITSRSEKVLLHELDARMPQQVVGRRDVEEELRDAEGEQQRPPGEGQLGPVLQPEEDLQFPGRIDLGARQAFE